MRLSAKFFGGIALKQINALAEQGNVTAQSEIGTMYALGQGVPQDYAQAAYWRRKAAEQGDADAQSNLAHMLTDLDSKNTSPISDTNLGKQQL
ncbi:MAG: hypothetical protein A2342_00485 [Gallionellales bacterium RIFOXYB12_FULL_54_9]|nr:MAG: hypothetical protein A2342_00485 [Gallionellales bacterium RIFOXYB12_FULL_54_9]